MASDKTSIDLWWLCSESLKRNDDCIMAALQMLFQLEINECQGGSGVSAKLSMLKVFFPGNAERPSETVECFSTKEHLGGLKMEKILKRNV